MPGIAGPSAGERPKKSATAGEKHHFEPEAGCNPPKPAHTQEPAAQAQAQPAEASASSAPRKVTTVYGTSRRGPSLGIPSAAFVVAMLASAAMHQIDLMPESSGSVQRHGHGRGRGIAQPPTTYTERLMATYERRLTNGYMRISELLWPGAGGLGGKHDDRHASKKEQQHRQRRDNEQRRQQEQHECARIGSRADCKANPECAYDSSRGCYKLDRHDNRKNEEPAKKHAEKPREAPKAAKQEAEKPREAPKAKPEPETKTATKPCEQTQNRKICKANPDCIYDTALGCYTKKKK